jgi:hypothetical protein
MITGLVAEERGDAVILRNAAQDGKLITILKKEIDERNDKGPSLMPERRHAHRPVPWLFLGNCDEGPLRRRDRREEEKRLFAGRGIACLCDPGLAVEQALG